MLKIQVNNQEWLNEKKNRLPNKIWKECTTWR